MEEMLGGTRITYLGHATFRIVTPGDEQILIDPFLTDNPATPDDLKEIGELDTMLITHGHFARPQRQFRQIRKDRPGRGLRPGIIHPDDAASFARDRFADAQPARCSPAGPGATRA